MAYIGTKPTIGNFQICDAISVVNGQAAYTMQVGGVNVSPQSASHMIVSLNGTIQKPGSSFTVSGSTITFASNLATGDVIDFIQILGDVLDLGVPSDATVTAAKIASDAVTTAKINDNAVTSAKLGTDVSLGKVLQVKYVRVDTDQALASTSFNDLTGVTLDITPASTSSKILILATVQADIPVGNRGWRARIVRGSTSVHEESGEKATYTSANRIQVMASYNYLDSPSTTSSTTYKVQVQQDGGGNIDYNDGGFSTLTLMEVSA
jgi:hypothetical protein